jgi:hypothetical protein
LGKYQFTSPDEVKIFNGQVSAWFLKRGFTTDSDKNFAAIVEQDEWKTPGLLLCQRIDNANQIFVFVPDCFHPEINRQIIGYHIKLKGAFEDVKKHKNEFELMQEEFKKTFPSTWEYKPDSD